MTKRYKAVFMKLANLTRLKYTEVKTLRTDSWKRCLKRSNTSEPLSNTDLTSHYKDDERR